ncbi:MAG: flagellar filament outer layer protein FlaA [Spirochaetia bacterium]|nr:flagellar filament outer layer protein FlaA [Spirochaetota bacterium]MCX8097251.1 flagellar filament outer layer protein FlaA [Spirochaetota bacterium]MDW8111859.1 flagellar filament outer layer protein FlaA [Spirochaetia bacterium]
MKKAVFVILFSVLAVSYLNGVVKEVLIDFSKSDELFQRFMPEPRETYETNENGVYKVYVSAQEYFIENWKVELNSSAKNMSLANMVNSYPKRVESKTYGSVLGIRARFPQGTMPAYAIIRPNFTIPAFDENGKFINVGNGVVINVNEIKSISIRVSGRNYPYQLAIRLMDRDFNIHEHFFGDLFFQGWKTLVWFNPNFIDDERLKIIKRDPLYPKPIPFYRLESIVIYKPPQAQGGDFITYIHSIEMEYTPFLIEPADDIDDESIWQILAKETIRRKNIEQSRMNDFFELLLRERKRLKMMYNELLEETRQQNQQQR